MSRPYLGLRKQAKTRVEPSLYQRALDKASAEGKTITSILGASLLLYVSTPAIPPLAPPAAVVEVIQEVTPEQLLITDPWEQLDPNLKEGQQRSSFEKFLGGREVSNLAQLERVEDEVVEIAWDNVKQTAKAKADTKSGTSMKLLTLELNDAEKKKAVEDRERAAYRRRRYNQLVALLSPALLRLPGNTRDQYQHAEQLWREATGDKAKRSYQGASLLGSASQSAFSTTGPATREDVRAAEKALKPKPDSS